jgi:hypothetical protein
MTGRKEDGIGLQVLTGLNDHSYSDYSELSRYIHSTKRMKRAQRHAFATRGYGAVISQMLAHQMSIRHAHERKKRLQFMLATPVEGS